MTTSELDRKLFAAAERLGRALRAARQELATRHAISLLAVEILQTLADSRTRRVGALAAELDITQATTSDALATLAGRGLVARTSDPGDRRATVVTLTDAGTELAWTIAGDLARLLPDADRDRAARGTALRVLLGEIARLHTAGIITVDRNCFSCQHYKAPAARARAHCLLLDLPLHDEDLRVDCPEHHPPPA